eukprot:5731726-Prymnesium_polylepis.1
MPCRRWRSSTTRLSSTSPSDRGSDARGGRTRTNPTTAPEDAAFSVRHASSASDGRRSTRCSLASSKCPVAR